MSKSTNVKKSKQSSNPPEHVRYNKTHLDDAPKVKKQKSSDYDFGETSMLQKDESVDDDTLDNNETESINVNEMLSNLGSSFNKKVSAKTKLTDQFSNAMIKTSVDFVDNVVVVQNKKREEFQKDFLVSLKELLKRKEAEMKLAKENEEKLIKNLLMHMKYSQQKLAMLSKLHKDIVDLSSTYWQTSEQLETAQASELEQVKCEIQSKLQATKKKFSKDMTGLDVSVMKKNLLQYLK